MPVVEAPAPAGRAPAPEQSMPGGLSRPTFATVGFRPADEILHAMRPETIAIPFQARAIRWPLIGWLLTKLRIFYQRPAMFYTALLSERQAPVNRVLGERILYLEALLQAQQQQIEALKAQSGSHLESEKAPDPLQPG